MRWASKVDASAGFAWSAGGWLLPSVLGKLGLETILRLQKRVLAELTTTFASGYTAEIPLAKALDLETLRAYNRRATGSKYLITPNG